ncbi:MAG: protein kinase [Acidobacteriota bacterium]
MGEVYLADDTRLHRQVALKILPREMAGDPERRARFQREARVIAALNHPNIVTIHSVEESGSVHFMTMERIRGQPLTRLIGRNGLPLDRLFELALPLTEAVAAAHRQGTTHRDLKPDNIMVGENSRVKVLDFGLARLQQESSAAGGAGTHLETVSATQEGRVLGTVAYMSPEQAEGKPVDPRSDVFSLGVILFEMATGQRPFTGATPISTISSILRDAPPSISQLNRTLPRHLGRIVKRCLAKDPDRRYQSALGLRNDLLELKEEHDSGELAAGALPGGARAPARRRWAVPAFLLGGGIILATAWGLLRLGTPGEAAGTGRPTASLRMTYLTRTGTSTAAAISPDGKYMVYVARGSDQRRSLRVRQIATRSDRELLPPAEVDFEQPVFSPDGNYVYYTSGKRGEPRSDLFQIPSLGGTPHRLIENVDSAVSLEPGGERLVFRRGDNLTGDSSIILASLDGSREQVLATSRAPRLFTGDPAWSPSGAYIATPFFAFTPKIHAGIVAIPSSGGTEQPVTRKDWFEVDDLAWLPDSSGLLAVANDRSFGSENQIWMFPFSGGTAHPLTSDLNSYDGLSLTADGASLVTTQGRVTSSLWLADGRGREAPRAFLPEGESRAGLGGLHWTPGGRLVYGSHATDNWALWMADPSGGEPVRIARGDHPEVFPSVTPDGRRVVFMSETGGTVNLWIMDLDGGGRRQLTHGDLDGEPRCTPDGREVVYMSLAKGIQTLWKVPLEGGSAVPISPVPVLDYDLSPDGARLLVLLRDPETERLSFGLLPMDGGKPVPLAGFSPTQFVRWAPDGAALTYIETREGVDNIWRRSLEGGEPVQLTRFTDLEIAGFAWSRDGGRLAVARVRQTSDIILIRGFAKD